MDLESLQTIAFLNAQNDLIDMNEEDAEVQAPEQSETQIQPTQTQQTPRKRRKTSNVWDDFISVGLESDEKERAKCIHCGTKLVICTSSRPHGNYGTNHLSRHLEKCPKMPKKIDRPVYDQKIDREMVSEVIIYHDLPFRYVEYEKVRARDKYLNPDYQPICRQTAAADVFVRYEVEKEKLKELFAKHRGRVSFTSDLWSAKASMTSYICVTGHFIDEGWHLHSYILDFCELKSPHTGEHIANRILDCLKEWGLEKKVLSMTLDNATNNNSMVKILKGQLQMISGSGLLCDGKFLHIRCCAHILNIIVKKGLELAKDVLHNIRESVLYVKASPQRKEAFAACVERVGIRSGAGLSLDVPTRWNSTYEMLARALKFRKAFDSMKAFDTNYKSLPSDDEWDHGEKICDLLKPFSVITTYISGSKYPTSNVYFTQVWRIELLLKKYVTCDDEDIKQMAMEMKIKFAKYWKDYSLILAIGAVLDPRLKVKMLEVAYQKVDPTTSALKIKELEKNLEMIFKAYQTSSPGVSGTTNPHDLLSESPLEDDFDNVSIFIYKVKIPY